MKSIILLTNGSVIECSYYYIESEANEINVIIEYSNESEDNNIFKLLHLINNGSIISFEKGEKEYSAVIPIPLIKKVEVVNK